MINRIKNSDIQMSDSLIIGCILTLSGGYMDAYTYIYRSGTFANAQTGNMILFGINLCEGSWLTSLRYLCPVFFFVTGIFLAELLRLHLNKAMRVHWRQIVIFLEIITLFVVGFISRDFNLLANSMVSCACGMQVQSFRKIRGNNLATTMCIGNIRAATDLLCNYWHTKDKSLLKSSLLYYEIILFFIVGAVFGNFGTKVFGQQAILFCPLLLLVVFILMMDKKEKQNNI